MCRNYTYGQVPVQQFWMLNRSTVSDTLVWDVGPWNRQINNGSGTLLVTNPVWTANKGNTNTKWNVCKNAVFGGNLGTGAAGTVTLGAAVNSVKSISFFPAASGNFTINSQSITTTCATDLPVFVSAGLQPTIASILTGTNSLIKNGAGALVLTGTNTYSGITNINGGILQIGAGGSAGSIPSASQVNIANNAILFWDIINGSQVLPNPISGAGSVQVKVAGNMSNTGGGDGTLSQITNTTNNYTGGTNILGGFVRANNAYLGTGTVSLQGGGLCGTGTSMTWSSNPINVPTGSTGYLRSFSNVTTTFATPISGIGTLQLADSGAIILTGNNPFNGNIIMSGNGDFSINGTGTLGSGNFYGNIDNPSGRTLSWNGTVSQTFNGIISSTNGNFWFNSGNTTLAGGANVPGSNWYLNTPTTGGIVTQNITGGTYLFNSYQIFQNNVNNNNLTLNISGGNLTFTTLGMGGSTAGGASNNKNTLNLTGGTVNVTGTFFPYKWATNYVNIANATMIANTYHVGWVDTGPICYITINSGGLFGFNNLQVEGWRNNYIYLNGGTLRPCNIPATTFVSFTVQSNGGTIDNNGSNISIAQVVTGSGGLTFVGSGTTTISGSNAYSGGTTISGGTLTASNVNAFGTGVIIVKAGATLNKNGFAISNTVINNGGTINP
ncbi:hypothetical protein EM308_13195 [Flavobacterium gilvum]|uniref:Uncharacterized protein n=2 Tax=Flavobacterium gilvum TaxID=1492737 RepID=A0AAC9I8V1_9FLAO|nr:hypothetical protein EM308_13195 [Flavobacterium gilvum]